MKAKIFLGGALATLVLGITACSVDEVIQSNPVMDGTESIAFKATLGHSTRATAVTSNTLREFSVWGWNADGLFMDHAPYYYTHDAYECNDLYLWPQAGASFIALTPTVEELGDDTKATIDPVGGTTEIEVEIPADNADQIDLCYAVALDNEPNTFVTLNFRHALSQIVFKAVNNNADITVDVAGVSLHSIRTSGKYTLPSATTTPHLEEGTSTSPAAGTQGTWAVGEPDNDSKFVAGMAVESKTLTSERESLMSEDGALFLIPQTTAEWDVETDPNQSNGGAYFLINCQIHEHGSQLWPETVGEFGEVAMPVKIEWEEGYRYTYTFIFGAGAGYYPPTDDTKPGEPVFNLINFEVTVDEFQDAGNVDVSTEVDDSDGSLDKPYSVSTALKLIEAGANTADTVYVKGVISEISEVSPLATVTAGHATYYMADAISDTGGVEAQIMVFDGLSLGGVEFASNDEIAVGDEVIVYGILDADEDETPEITESIIYSLNGETYEEPEEEPGPEEEGELVYGNDFDKEEATQSYGSGSSWPYPDQFDGWQNEEGSGIESVSYKYNNVSVRSNSNSNGSYSNYDGSGTNNIFFGSTTNYFVIQNITLPSEATDYTLTFGSEKYLSGGSGVFSHTEFHVYLSNDGLKWVELSYAFPDGDPDSTWDEASTTFTLPSGTESLYIYYTADVASAYRIDDVKLTTTSEEGTAIDFSTGVELDGGDQEPEEYELVGDGTLDNPYTAADANWLATSGEYTSDEVYVKGIISQIDELSTSYGNATYYISDDGTTDGQFEIYRGYSLGGQKFTSEDEIQIGDEVIVCGQITLYGSTAEMATGSSIYSINGQTYEAPDTGDLEGDGTVDNPYSASEALAIINAGTYTSSNVYVSGIISQIDEIDTGTYGNATYYISDDGATSSQLEVYRGYSLGGVRFTSSDEIKVGDEVVVYGQLTMYYSTPEITSGSSIYSLNGKTYEAPEVEGTTGSGTIDDPYTASDAISIIANDSSYDQKVYITGTVSQIGSLNSSYHELNYYISDDGTTTNQLYVYCGYGLNGEGIYSTDYLSVGDVVVIYGELKVYNGGAEVNYGSTIISINGSTTGGDSGDTGGSGDTGDLPTFTSNVSWTLGSSASSDKATINGTEYDVLKLGSGSKTGDAAFTIPAGSTSLAFYCFGWNGKTDVPYTVTIGDDSHSLTAQGNSGFHDSSPYTAVTVNDDSDYQTITFNSALTSDTTVTVATTSSSNGRVVFAGINYYTD